MKYICIVICFLHSIAYAQDSRVFTYQQNDNIYFLDSSKRFSIEIIKINNSADTMYYDVLIKNISNNYLGIERSNKASYEGKDTITAFKYFGLLEDYEERGGNILILPGEMKILKIRESQKLFKLCFGFTIYDQQLILKQLNDNKRSYYYRIDCDAINKRNTVILELDDYSFIKYGYVDFWITDVSNNLNVFPKKQMKVDYY